MDIFYIIIGFYILTGIIVLFFSPLKDEVKNGFEDLVFEYFRGNTIKDKISGTFGLIALLTILIFTIALFPIILGVRFYMETKTSGNSIPQKEKIKTKQTLHPIKNHIVEERDYELSKGKFIELRKYSYDDNNSLIGIAHFNNTDKLFYTKKYFYNSKGQRYAETSINIESKVEIRTFHLFDNYGRAIATYGELESGHQYCHEFAYDQNGEQHTTSMSTLRRDIDLLEIFKDDLKRQESESKPKTKRYSGGTYREPWSCSLCDGDETTGCLWHDPTECPR